MSKHTKISASKLNKNRAIALFHDIRQT